MRKKFQLFLFLRKRPSLKARVLFHFILKGTLRRDFFAHVKKEPGGCWIWTGQRKKKGGYGRKNFGAANIKCLYSAHKLSFLIANGIQNWDELPPVIRHTCDNPPCVRPSHLLGGTYKDNVHDMFERGRANRPKGERNGSAKLKLTEVTAIRKSTGTLKEMASTFGVSITTVRKIRKGESWKGCELPRGTA
ncbi:MAG: hypothetical protein K2W95_15590 [Candidatus Obscuribacterales bacterium]|nr:hypothetical protein [Candidatus Obscuribacterales bacterium]